MRSDLSRRLLDSGLIEESELESALFLSWMRDIHVLRALVERGSVLEHQIEEEAARLGQLPLRQVSPAADLVARLPAGTCRRLAAIPTRHDPISGVVDAAALDPFDTHVERELGFHLGASVRLRFAPLAILEDRIRALDPPQPPLRRLRHITPAFPHGAPNSSLPPAPADETPIPLVRKLSPSEGVAALRALGLQPREDFPHEPDLQGEEHEPPRRSGNASVPPPATMRGVLRALGVAGSRDEVVRQVLRGCRLFARRVSVFVVKRDGFHGWACNESFGDAAALRRVAIPHGSPSVLATAIAAGGYRGPLVRGDVRAGVPALSGEVIAQPVLVQGRPAMVLLAGGIETSQAPSSAAQEAMGALAEAAAEALARILASPP